MNRRRTLALVPVLAIVLSAGACSSDDNHNVADGRSGSSGVHWLIKPDCREVLEGGLTTWSGPFALHRVGPFHC